MKTKEMSAKYQVVYKELKEAIVSGRIPVGEKVPSELQSGREWRGSCKWPDLDGAGRK